MHPIYPLCGRSFSLPQFAIALTAVALPISGCSSANSAKVNAATRTVYRDASSAAGQKLLADVTSAALNVGLDIASGNDAGAALAGIQGAANTLRDYEGLPTAPGSAKVARAAAAGSGLVNSAPTLAPNIETLVSNAHKTASRQRVNISADNIIEAIARGFDGVADARSVRPH